MSSSSSSAHPVRVSEGRRPFSSEAVSERLARLTNVAPKSRVLELGGGVDGLALHWATEHGCEVLAVDSPEALEPLSQQVRISGVSNRIELQPLSGPLAEARLSVPEGELEVALVHTGSALLPEQAIEWVTAGLAFHGKLCLFAVTRVGRHTAPHVLAFWEERLGAKLLLPAELGARFARAGYETEAIDTLSDIELDTLYRDLESRLNGKDAAFRDELALFHGAGSKAGYSFTSVVGRKKQPGERPAPARTRG